MQNPNRPYFNLKWKMYVIQVINFFSYRESFWFSGKLDSRFEHVLQDYLILILENDFYKSKTMDGQQQSK